MSNYIEPSSGRSCGSGSRNDKPNHVKCLNFGRSILELDVKDRLSHFATSDRALVVDKNVAHIPCTEKKDYVRKWIETHEDGVSDPTDDSSQLSPILGKSRDKTLERSPVLGNSKKRHRKKACTNKHTRNVDDTDCQRSTRYSTNCTIQQDDESREENRNDQEYLHKIQYTPPCAEVIAEGSPILGTQTHRNKRRRKLCFEMEDSSKRLKLDDDKITNIQLEIDDNYDSLSDKSADYDMLEDSDSNVKETVFRIETEESPKGLQRCTSTILSQITQGSKDDSNCNDNNKAKLRIELDSSDESNEKEYKKFSSSNNSISNSLTNVIEDADSQDINNRLLVLKTSQQPSPKSLVTSESRSKLSQLVANDLDETYCSEAEITKSQSTQYLSAKISLVASLPREATESKSTSTPVISTISTPSKVSPNKTMYAHLLDSGKKRLKAKKKSMVAKLQSLINAQISGMRIWRHRMNKKYEAESAQFISVLVRDCTKRFGNQFLKGSLIEDRFNLLQSNVEIKETESCNVQPLPRKTMYRNLTIILVCDIVGTLKMMSEVVINIYPPWQVLDLVDLTIEAMYIKISHVVPPYLNSDEDLNAECKHEKQIVKEFSCPCIEEEREFPFCARKRKADKPDVMQEIFDF